MGVYTSSHLLGDDKERERGGKKVGAGLLLPWCYAAVSLVMVLQLLLGNNDGCCHVDKKSE